MILAAIDIGSNAARLQISRVVSYDQVDAFKRIEYIRFPLRLGKDVFTSGMIGDDKRLRLKKLMRAFKILIELYKVDDFTACATAAIREANNGLEIANEVFQETGIRINVIDGLEETTMINRAINSIIDNKDYLHIDVGGGSTELSFFSGQKKVRSESFTIGTVRVRNEELIKESWDSMKKWIRSNRSYFRKVKAIGTGGNINKLFDLAYTGKTREMSFSKLKSLRSKLSKMNEDKMINYLLLNPDRADVIIPAADIYLNAMKWAGASKIIVPKLGLKDGIISSLYLKNKAQLSLEFQ